MDQNQSLLLRLPKELRDAIWSYALPAGPITLQCGNVGVLITKCFPRTTDIPTIITGLLPQRLRKMSDMLTDNTCLLNKGLPGDTDILLKKMRSLFKELPKDWSIINKNVDLPSQGSSEDRNISGDDTDLLPKECPRDWGIFGKNTGLPTWLRSCKMICTEGIQALSKSRIFTAISYQDTPSLFHAKHFSLTPCTPCPNTLVFSAGVVQHIAVFPTKRIDKNHLDNELESEQQFLLHLGRLGAHNLSIELDWPIYGTDKVDEWLLKLYNKQWDIIQGGVFKKVKLNFWLCSKPRDVPEVDDWEMKDAESWVRGAVGEGGKMVWMGWEKGRSEVPVGICWRNTLVGERVGKN